MLDSILGTVPFNCPPERLSYSRPVWPSTVLFGNFCRERKSVDGNGESSGAAIKGSLRYQMWAEELENSTTLRSSSSCS